PSVNHRLPSGPVVIPPRFDFAVGTVNSLTVPVGVIWPILLPSPSVNHRLPSGPVVISPGVAAAVGIEYEVKAGEPATGGVSLGAAEELSLGALADPEGACDELEDLEHPASSMVTTARPSTPAVVLWRRSLRVTRSTYGLIIRTNEDSRRSKLTHSHAEAGCRACRTLERNIKPGWDVTDGHVAGGSGRRGSYRAQSGACGQGTTGPYPSSPAPTRASPRANRP